MTADEYVVEELLQAKKDFNQVVNRNIGLQKQLKEDEENLEHITELLDIIRSAFTFVGKDRLKYCAMRNIWEDDDKTIYNALKELFYIEGDDNNE